MMKTMISSVQKNRYATSWHYLAVAGVAALAWTVDSHAQFWTLSGVPSDVSADGAVVVGDNNSSGEYFEWTAATGMMDIGGVTAGGGVGGTARISDDASRVSGTNFNTVSGFHEISYYERGTSQWTSVGGIGAPCSTEISSGWDISADGNHIVGLGWLTCADAHAVQWTDGGSVVDLGSSVANESSRANGVNADGTVVAGWQDGAGREGAVWINGVQTVISGTGEGTAVSDDGQYVVGIGGSATVANGVAQAWRWSQGGGLEPLGAIVPGSPFPPAPRGFATDVSGDGSTVIGFDRSGFGPPVPISEGWNLAGGNGHHAIG